jgi:hypothetical protein
MSTYDCIQIHILCGLGLLKSCIWKEEKFKVVKWAPIIMEKSLEIYLVPKFLSHLTSSGCNCLIISKTSTNQWQMSPSPSPTSLPHCLEILPNYNKPLERPRGPPSWEEAWLRSVEDFLMKHLPFTHIAYTYVTGKSYSK